LLVLLLLLLLQHLPPGKPLHHEAPSSDDDAVHFPWCLWGAHGDGALHCLQLAQLATARLQQDCQKQKPHRKGRRHRLH
jgi:hypothetical protein